MSSIKDRIAMFSKPGAGQAWTQKKPEEKNIESKPPVVSSEPVQNQVINKSINDQIVNEGPKNVPDKIKEAIQDNPIEAKNRIKVWEEALKQKKVDVQQSKQLGSGKQNIVQSPKKPSDSLASTNPQKIVVQQKPQKVVVVNKLPEKQIQIKLPTQINQQTIIKNQQPKPDPKPATVEIKSNPVVITKEFKPIIKKQEEPQKNIYQPEEPKNVPQNIKQVVQGQNIQAGDRIKMWEKKLIENKVQVENSKATINIKPTAIIPVKKQTSQISSNLQTKLNQSPNKIEKPIQTKSDTLTPQINLVQLPQTQQKSEVLKPSQIKKLLAEKAKIQSLEQKQVQTHKQTQIQHQKNQVKQVKVEKITQNQTFIEKQKPKEQIQKEKPNQIQPAIKNQQPTVIFKPKIQYKIKPKNASSPVKTKQEPQPILNVPMHIKESVEDKNIQAKDKINIQEKKLQQDNGYANGEKIVIIEEPKEIAKMKEQIFENKIEQPITGNIQIHQQIEIKNIQQLPIQKIAEIEIPVRTTQNISNLQNIEIKEQIIHSVQQQIQQRLLNQRKIQIEDNLHQQNIYIRIQNQTQPQIKNQQLPSNQQSNVQEQPVKSSNTVYFNEDTISNFFDTLKAVLVAQNYRNLATIFNFLKPLVQKRNQSKLDIKNTQKIQEHLIQKPFQKQILVQVKKPKRPLFSSDQEQNVQVKQKFPVQKQIKVEKKKVNLFESSEDETQKKVLVQAPKPKPKRTTQNLFSDSQDQIKKSQKLQISLEAGNGKNGTTQLQNPIQQPVKDTQKNKLLSQESKTKKTKKNLFSDSDQQGIIKIEQSSQKQILNHPPEIVKNQQLVKYFQQSTPQIQNKIINKIIVDDQTQNKNIQVHHQLNALLPNNVQNVQPANQHAILTDTVVGQSVHQSWQNVQYINEGIEVQLPQQKLQVKQIVNNRQIIEIKQEIKVIQVKQNVKKGLFDDDEEPELFTKKPKLNTKPAEKANKKPLFGDSDEEPKKQQASPQPVLIEVKQKKQKKLFDSEDQKQKPAQNQDIEIKAQKIQPKKPSLFDEEEDQNEKARETKVIKRQQPAKKKKNLFEQSDQEKVLIVEAKPTQVKKQIKKKNLFDDDDDEQIIIVKQKPIVSQQKPEIKKKSLFEDDQDIIITKPIKKQSNTITEQKKAKKGLFDQQSDDDFLGSKNKKPESKPNPLIRKTDSHPLEQPLKKVQIEDPKKKAKKKLDLFDDLQ